MVDVRSLKTKGILGDLVRRLALLLTRDDIRDMLDKLCTTMPIEELAKEIGLSRQGLYKIIKEKVQDIRLETRAKILACMLEKRSIETLDLLAERSLTTCRLTLWLLLDKIYENALHAKKAGDLTKLEELRNVLSDLISKYVCFVIDPRDFRLSRCAQVLNVPIPTIIRPIIQVNNFETADYQSITQHSLVRYNDQQPISAVGTATSNLIVTTTPQY